MDKPTLFIGSSSEGLDIAEAVQISLDRECEVTLWTQGIFLLGLSNLENLTRTLGDYDFAVLVLTPDDVLNSRGSQQSVCRDNVIFELGLFMGAIGRDRAFALFDRTADLRIPSDLAGISLAGYSPHSSGNAQSTVGAACIQIKQSIRRIGSKVKNSPSVFRSVDSPTLFGLGTELLTKAKSRVALVAKTPVLITGPRPYGETVQYPWEIEQFSILNSLVKTAGAGNGLDFRCIASLSSLQDELKKETIGIQQSVSANLSSVFSSISETSTRISLRWSNDRYPMTYLVVDDNFLLWFKDADDKFCLQRQDYRIANALWQQATTNSCEMTAQDLSNKLGLNFNE
jgi:predicted nucleotide-binding protein